MKQISYFVLGLLIMGAATRLPGQTPSWLWANTAGGEGWDMANAIAADSQGNLYITGIFEDEAQFGSATLTSYGARDIFIAKLDPAGNWIWQVPAGGSGYDRGTAIATGDIWLYAAGEFYGSSTFGSVNYTSEGTSDLFVAILDFDGNWAAVDRTTGSGDPLCSSLALDAAENMYLTGEFMGEVTFGQTTLLSSGYGNRDIFIAKLNRIGTWDWAAQAGAPGNSPDGAAEVVLDAAGNIYLTGHFFETAQFGSTSLTSAGGADIFLAKLDPQGNWLWAVQAGGTDNDFCETLTLDALGNLVISGRFRGTASFGDHSLVCVGQENYFVAKAGPGGDWAWAEAMNGALCSSLAADSEGNVYGSGSIWLPNALGFYVQTHGGTDLFAGKLDPAGNWIWAQAAGSYGANSSCRGLDILLGGSGNACIAGVSEGNAYFNSLDGEPFELSFGDKDVVVAKLGEFTPAADDLAQGPEHVSALRGLFPNPARGGVTATVSVCLKAGDNGVLTLYNSRGQSIRDWRLDPGDYQLGLDCGPLPAGIYFCRLQTPSGSAIRRFAVIK